MSYSLRYAANDWFTLPCFLLFLYKHFFSAHEYATNQMKNKYFPKFQESDEFKSLQIQKELTNNINVQARSKPRPKDQCLPMLKE